jgi:hypothetical protein
MSDFDNFQTKRTEISSLLFNLKPYAATIKLVPLSLMGGGSNHEKLMVNM